MTSTQLYSDLSDPEVIGQGALGAALKSFQYQHGVWPGRSVGGNEPFGNQKKPFFSGIYEAPKFGKGYHAFQRGLATVLYSLGVPDKIIQRILRHSGLNVTMSSYVKTGPEDVKQEMKKLEKAWKKTKPKAASQVAVPVAAASKRELLQ